MVSEEKANEPSQLTYQVGGGGAEAEASGDAQEEVLPEEELGLGPVAALPREGLEPGVEVGAVWIVPPARTAHLRSHRRLPPFSSLAIVGCHNNQTTAPRWAGGTRDVAAAVAHRGRERTCK